MRGEEGKTSFPESMERREGEAEGESDRFELRDPRLIADGLLGDDEYKLVSIADSDLPLDDEPRVSAGIFDDGMDRENG